MNLIVCVNNRMSIGKQGGLIYSIPEDMRFFRQMTAGKTVVMGRATLESLPGGKPLKNRKNIVLSHNPPKEQNGAVYCSDLSELSEAIKEDNTDDVFVIGGGMLYRLLYPYCKTAYVTVVDDDLEGDAHFPDLTADDNWKETYTSEEKEHEGLRYVFKTFVNSDPISF